MLTRQHIPILRRAHEYIAGDHLTYICNAVDRAAAMLGADYDEVKLIRDIIKAGLADVHYPGSPRFELWLAYHLGVSWTSIEDDTLALARLAWIDKMIYDIEKGQP